MLPETENRQRYQSDVRSGLPQSCQSPPGHILERGVSGEATQRGELQDEGSDAGGAGDWRFSGTDTMQQVHRPVRHPSGGLKSWKDPYSDL